MKKQFALSAIILTTALVGGLGTPDPTIACPFARNQGTSIIQNNLNSPFPLARKFNSHMMLGVAATLGLLATGWVVASRLNKGSQMSEPDAQDDFEVSSFSIPIPPEALATSKENAEEIMSIR